MCLDFFGRGLETSPFNMYIYIYKPQKILLWAGFETCTWDMYMGESKNWGGQKLVLNGPKQRICHPPMAPLILRQTHM